jgi:hypothetical protein
MASSIPEYYRHLAEQASKQIAEGAGSPPPPKSGTGRRPGARPRQTPAVPVPPGIPFRADRFTIQLYEGWRDNTIYFLGGPVADGLPHNVVVLVEAKPDAPSLQDFADVQIRSLEDELKGCRVLLRGPVKLYNGLDAIRVLYSWYPADGARFYQEQIFVLHQGAAYKLTATFTKKTRKTLGPQVERIMLSFDPSPPPG